MPSASVRCRSVEERNTTSGTQDDYGGKIELFPFVMCKLTAVPHVSVSDCILSAKFVSECMYYI